MKTLLWIFLFLLLFYYAMKLFLQYVVPWLLRRHVRKQQERFNGFSRKQEQSREGDVHIRGKSASKKKDDKDFGEYVDFEDITE